MRRLVWAWVAGTVTYLVVLTGGAVLVGVLASRADGPVAAWPLLVVPALLAGSVAVPIAVARTAARPSRLRGLAAVSVPAVAALGSSLAAAAEAASRADVPVSVQVSDVALPVLLLLATGALGGVLAHVRWSPPIRSSYVEVV
ncbi:hypothetical protein [Cellulomonas sp. S1-8]|uniref:hypothetical protein n=1 Tax=Cellulomonas sp. S1-8 TaxID=2904790 RepID=UPI002244BA2C|nr:hypothetical protein [Cellulomonas sp. S1-8]UZN02142.1 hypothetical protein OKX07_13735 [Cellulomonas sp. S1-8]